MALVLGLAQILFLQLVAIVTLDDDKNAHYAVASAAVLLGVAREAVMLWRRAHLPPSKKPSCQEVLRAVSLFSNLVFFLLLIALIFAFGGITAANEHDFESLDVCLIEYSIFFVTFYLMVYQDGDFNPTTVTPMKSSPSKAAS